MKAELLAPAGSYEAMTAAVAAGADAVYLGGSNFGARAYAKNLDEKEILEAIDYVHLHNRKLYLTVNTLFKEEELYGQLFDYLLPYYKQGLDAVIVQDLGALSCIRRWFPDLAVHASTQMTITGAAGARFLEQQGAVRVVPARELSLQEIRKIRRTTGLEIECFVHGALCYCYSGQCLFSSLIGARSGNRGRCAQPCRLPYEAFENGKRIGEWEDRYPLSPKDMCTVELLPEILKAGVTSLKIEGRMKRPEYTAGVVSIYRKYLDLLEENPGRYRVLPEDLKTLWRLYNRDGFHRGYYTVRNGREMMALRNEKEDNGKNTRKNEQLYYELQRDYLNTPVKEPVTGFLTLYPDTPASLTVYDRAFCVTAVREGVQTAKKQPLNPDRVKAQLEKTRNTPFYFRELDLSMDENVFVPLQTLNELRRDAMEQLALAITLPYRRNGKEKPEDAVPDLKGKREDVVPVLSASAETKEQLKALMSVPDIHRIYASCDCFSRELLEEQVLAAAAQLKSGGRELYLALPHAVREGELSRIRPYLCTFVNEGVYGFLVRNLESYAVLKELGLAAYAVLDYSVYTMNSAAQKFWEKEGVLSETVPLELNKAELKRRDNSRSEMIVYGYLPMMVSVQCVKKNLSGCTASNAQVQLKDRIGKYFTVKCYCSGCYNVIYNTVPLGLLKEADEVKELCPQSVRLSFTIENGKETYETAVRFASAYAGGSRVEEDREYTKGHFRRKVE